ncbi:hypothetical protein UFOVP496_51 [uncultured Caudovirales phage]|uniref:Uncharacterized protein n=1 Tax=uncultured Caudovirales phage TaxID=2100421 RepID=A0A6J5MP75_9CAUD|nr:hypothetical protein UFOVP496_51 [uncultured Caudovirales phage]
MTNDTPIITQLRETINRAENMVPFMRQDMIQLLEGAKFEIETLAANLKQMQNERDEARRVLKSIVEEFVQHAQTMNPFYPATPMHECEFSWNPECGKCNACEAWGDYVLICHPLGDTEEEEAP